MNMKGKTPDERSCLVQFFADLVEREARPIGVRLGHYKDIGLLYALKSQVQDRLRRPCGNCLIAGATEKCVHSLTTAQKYFWYITRTQV